MSVKNFDMNEPLPKLKQPFECPFCGKKYKTKKPYENHIDNCPERPDGSEISDEEDNFDSAIVESKHTFNEKNPEVEKLRKELLQILMSNPNIDLTSPVSLTPFQSINSMNVEELQARIFQAKRELSSKTDLKISDSALGLVNLFFGNMLGCLDELQHEVEKDLLLRESVKDTLSLNLLSRIPPQLKVTGLYAMNVGTALSKARAKRSSTKEEESSN